MIGGAVKDTHLGCKYKLHILSLAGDCVASFTPDPDPGMGIRSVAWHPTGVFLAVGGWDDRVGCISC